MNKVILIGNLGRDPEYHNLSNGGEVCNLSVATVERWKDKAGESRSETTWHRVVVWGPQARACVDFLARGARVAVEGKIDERKWTDKDGNERVSIEIRASSVEFLTKKEHAGSPSASIGEQSGGWPTADDDIPF